MQIPPHPPPTLQPPSSRILIGTRYILPVLETITFVYSLVNASAILPTKSQPSITSPEEDREDLQQHPIPPSSWVNVRFPLATTRRSSILTEFRAVWSYPGRGFVRYSSSHLPMAQCGEGNTRCGLNGVEKSAEA